MNAGKIHCAGFKSSLLAVLASAGFWHCSMAGAHVVLKNVDEVADHFNPFLSLVAEREKQGRMPDLSEPSDAAVLAHAFDPAETVGAAPYDISDAEVLVELHTVLEGTPWMRGAAKQGVVEQQDEFVTVVALQLRVATALQEVLLKSVGQREDDGSILSHVASGSEQVLRGLLIMLADPVLTARNQSILLDIYELATANLASNIALALRPNLIEMTDALADRLDESHRSQVNKIGTVLRSAGCAASCADVSGASKD